MGQQTSVQIVGTRTNKTGKEGEKAQEWRVENLYSSDNAMGQYLANMLPQCGAIYSSENYSDLTQTEQLLILSDPFCK